jgi:hypothetical protein
MASLSTTMSASSSATQKLSTPTRALIRCRIRALKSSKSGKKVPRLGQPDVLTLPNGTYMLADCCGLHGPGQRALASISGSIVNWTVRSSYYKNDNQGYAPLPDGNVLMVDVWDYNFVKGNNDYEIYNTPSGKWRLAGKTADCLSSLSYHDIGPAPLTPQYGSQGTIMQFTANTTLGVNDVYSVANGTWASGPVMKAGSTIYDSAYAPAATLPDGNPCPGEPQDIENAVAFLGIQRQLERRGERNAGICTSDPSSCIAGPLNLA